MNKKIKFENCLYVLFSIIGIIYGLYVILKLDAQKIRIFDTTLWGIVLIIVFMILLIMKIVLLVLKKNQKIQRILFYICISVISIVAIDVIFLGIIRSFIDALNLSKKPTSLDPLNIRIAYIIIVNYKIILSGIWTTIWLSLAGTIVGLIISLLFISLKTLEITPVDNEFTAFIKKVCHWFVDIYVTVFRGTPMMVQAIIIFYFLPGILAGIFNVDQQILNNILSVKVAGFITVTLNTTAYLTEVLRGGIGAIDKGQMEASRSLGMTRGQAMRFVILPQCMKNSLPAIGNEFIINIKDTSVLSVISVMDLFFIIDSINKRNASQDGIFIAAIVYLVLTLGISKLLSIVEKKMNLQTKPLPSSN